jgi:hypothetical protein
MLTIRAMSDGKGYSSRHLEHADYYAEGERVVGHWQGHGAEILGLGGEVKSEDFEALRQGLDPETGEFLRQRQSTDRLRSDGTKQSHGRHLYDFTISAPKSVSILAVVGGDKRLIDAHEEAVAEALKELEAHAVTRVRQDGANNDRTTGNLAIAVYHHDTSRELDPQLHTHAVTANLTYDGAEGRWKPYRHPAFTSAGPTLLRSTAIPSRARCGRLVTKSRTVAMPRGGMPALKFAASPGSFSPSTVNAAGSATKPSRNSPKRRDAHRLTTKSRCVCANRALTN